MAKIEKWGRVTNASVEKNCTTSEDYIHPGGYPEGSEKCMVPSEIV